MQGRHLSVGVVAEHDGRGARPDPGEIDAESVGVIAVGVEAKASAHRRDRQLSANYELLTADDDLDAGHEHRLGCGSVSTPGPKEYQPHRSLQISGCSGTSVRTASSGSAWSTPSASTDSRVPAARTGPAASGRRVRRRACRAALRADDRHRRKAALDASRWPRPAERERSSEECEVAGETTYGAARAVEQDRAVAQIRGRDAGDAAADLVVVGGPLAIGREVDHADVVACGGPSAQITEAVGG